MELLEQLLKESRSSKDYVSQYFERMKEILDGIDRDILSDVINLMEAGIEADKSLICMANGGSSSVASHFVNDAVAGAAVPGAKPWRVVSLSDNGEVLTAIGNDCGFEHVFRVQIEAAMRQGDIVLAMSVSGNSPNLVNAMRWAKANGGKTIAWVGMKGGQLADIADFVIRIPSTRDEYGPVEDAFSILMHVVFTYIAMNRGKKLYH